MKYYSAKDIWVKILIFSSKILLIGSVFIIPQDYLLIYLAFILSGIFFLGWIYFGTYYELREEYLFCKSGPFVEKIKYDDIKSLRFTQNMYSSMALSSKRIEIRQRKKNFIIGTTYISPEDREKFLEELKGSCKNLES